MTKSPVMSASPGCRAGYGGQALDFGLRAAGRKRCLERGARAAGAHGGSRPGAKAWAARPSGQRVPAPAIRVIPSALWTSKKLPGRQLPGWPSKISVQFLMFAPKQATQASAGLAPGLVRGGARLGGWAREPWQLTWFAGSQASPPPTLGALPFCTRTLKPRSWGRSGVDKAASEKEKSHFHFIG